MSSTLTYADSSVLIQGAAKSTSATFARKMRALQILHNPNRIFVSSEFVKLEVLPKALWFRNTREVEFYNSFFLRVEMWLPDPEFMSSALDLASKFGLGALDALHLCAARHFNAEFISAEKPTKPIYRAYSNISSIYED